MGDAEPAKDRLVRAALVTGGSSGIGLAIARMLRDEGFELTLSARTPEKLEAAAGELDAHAVIANVAEEEDCERLVREHAERFGRLDVLVNSAGVGLGGPIEQMSTKKWDLQLDVNLRGTFIVTRESIPMLRESRGLVVNLASIAGTVPVPMLAAYGASKAARDLADELHESRARGRRHPHLRALPRLRRHADGGMDRHVGRRDDPTGGLRGDRPAAATAQSRCADSPGRG